MLKWCHAIRAHTHTKGHAHLCLQFITLPSMHKRLCLFLSPLSLRVPSPHCEGVVFSPSAAGIIKILVGPLLYSMYYSMYCT